tara:strand:+ start:9 stop:140 length:132 start_codon:yes stop_codon:yes gene_type:complete
MSTLNPYKADTRTPVVSTTLARSLAEQKKAAEAAKKKEESKSE